jgi:hypothetical protein
MNSNSVRNHTFWNILIIHSKGSFSFYLNSLNLAQEANISANLLRVSILNTSVWENWRLSTPTRDIFRFFICLCIPCDMSWAQKTRIYVNFWINKWATRFKSPDSSWTPFHHGHDGPRCERHTRYEP